MNKELQIFLLIMRAEEEEPGAFGGRRGGGCRTTFYLMMLTSSSRRILWIHVVRLRDAGIRQVIRIAAVHVIPEEDLLLRFLHAHRVVTVIAGIGRVRALVVGSPRFVPSGPVVMVAPVMGLPRLHLTEDSLLDLIVIIVVVVVFVPIPIVVSTAMAAAVVIARRHRRSRTVGTRRDVVRNPLHTRAARLWGLAIRAAAGSLILNNRLLRSSPTSGSSTSGSRTSPEFILEHG